MKINSSDSTTTRAATTDADEFSVQEFHDLATDPDFKVTVLQAKKLGVDSFEQAEALMASLPLGNESVISLFAIARNQLLWVSGQNTPLMSRLAYQLSDERLELLELSTGDVAPKLFHEQMTLLIESVASLLDGHEKDDLKREAASIAAAAANERDAAGKLFPLMFSVIVPEWERAATREVQKTQIYVEDANKWETDYFSQFSYSHFMQGQTARWIDRAIESPQKHGLKHSSLSGTFAVYRLQSALLCDVICYDKEIAVETLPETLQLDVEHLLRLQKRFNELVKSRSTSDFYAATLGKAKSKEECDRFNALVDQQTSPVSKLHRERIRGLLIEAAEKGSINEALVDKWHYRGMLGELKDLNLHITRILQVHFPVFSDIYSTLLEGHLESAICTSILSLDGNREFQNWLGAEECEEAFGIRSDFNDLVQKLTPLVRETQKPFVEHHLKGWLLGSTGWNAVGDILNKTLSTEKIKKLESLFERISTFREQVAKSRYELCEQQKSAILPSSLKTGW